MLKTHFFPPFLLILIHLTLLIPTEAAALGKKQRTALMGVMGDSISAATFADTAALELHSEFLIENKSTLSWASGKKINSHYVRLKKIVEANSNDEETISVLNVAVPGNQARHMEGQAEQLVNAMKSGRYTELKYVTWMIGANDVCAAEPPGGTPDLKMADQLKRAFQKLAMVRQKEKIKILVSLMPKIPDLGKPEIQEIHTLGNLTCRTVRNEILKLCNSLLLWENASEYEQNLAFVADKNALIESIAREAQSKYPNLDISVSTVFFETEITPKMLAMDCFHPNQYGQQEIADRLWQDQPWF